MSDLDPDRLADYLRSHFPEAGATLALERVGGGQSNPTWFVDWGGRRLVLRKKPPGLILKGAHAVEREFRVMQALRHTPVPVPEVLRLEEDPAILGTPFYLMERVEGRVFADCALPGIPPDERRAMYLSMAETLAKLHAVDPALVGLGDFGRPGNYFERQIGRWSKQYRASTGPAVPALDRLATWLPENLPPDDGDVAIAHGDFRLGNMLFHEREPRVVAVLDWELSTLGHPLADLGFCVMTWRTRPDEYGGILGLDREALGIPPQQAFVARYYAAARPTAPLLPFHVAFAFFRFAVIFVGISDRARAGNAASGEEAANLAPLAARFAQRGLEAAGLAPPAATG
jgi:aminoglycoside phosphotransferase (APT) family kinase protein